MLKISEIFIAILVPLIVRVHIFAAEIGCRNSDIKGTNELLKLIACLPTSLPIPLQSRVLHQKCSDVKIDESSSEGHISVSSPVKDETFNMASWELCGGFSEENCYTFSHRYRDLLEIQKDDISSGLGSTDSDDLLSPTYDNMVFFLCDAAGPTQTNSMFQYSNATLNLQTQGYVTFERVTKPLGENPLHEEDSGQYVVLCNCLNHGYLPMEKLKYFQEQAHSQLGKSYEPKDGSLAYEVTDLGSLNHDQVENSAKRGASNKTVQSSHQNDVSNCILSIGLTDMTSDLGMTMISTGSDSMCIGEVFSTYLQSLAIGMVSGAKENIPKSFPVKFPKLLTSEAKRLFQGGNSKPQGAQELLLRAFQNSVSRETESGSFHASFAVIGPLGMLTLVATDHMWAGLYRNGSVVHMTHPSSGSIVLRTFTPHREDVAISQERKVLRLSEMMHEYKWKFAPSDVLLVMTNEVRNSLSLSGIQKMVERAVQLNHSMEALASDMVESSKTRILNEAVYDIGVIALKMPAKLRIQPKR